MRHASSAQWGQYRHRAKVAWSSENPKYRNLYQSKHRGRSENPTSLPSPENRMKNEEMMSWEVLFSLYCRQLIVANYSPETIRTLTVSFNRFSEFLDESTYGTPGWLRCRP